MSPQRRQEAARPRKGRGAVVGLTAAGVLAAILALLSHKDIEGYVESVRERAKAVRLSDARQGVAGTVTFAGGPPVSGARVRLLWRDAAGTEGETVVQSAVDGTFSAGELPQGAVVTEVDASLGPISATARVDATAGGGSSARDVAVELPREFQLAGLVRRNGDRTPVAGASLEIGGVRVRSGADGAFKLDRVPADVLRDGRPVVRVVADGYTALDWPLPRDEAPESYGDLTILLEATR